MIIWQCKKCKRRLPLSQAGLGLILPLHTPTCVDWYGSSGCSGEGQILIHELITGETDRIPEFIKPAQ